MTQQMNEVAGAASRPQRRHLAAAVAIVVATWAGTAGAAGLGRLSVASALGQPLQAEVEVTSVTPEEAASLSARIASPDAFREAGLQFNSALSGLRMAVQERRGRHFVRITSSTPLNEPFVDLMVELNWSAGKFVREYTFLLDPPELRSPRQTVDGSTSAASRFAPPVSAAAAAAASRGNQAQAPSQQSAPGRASGSPSANPAFAQSPGADPGLRAQPGTGGADRGVNRSSDRSADARPADPGRASGRAAPGDTVTVARGDSLGKIAAAVKPPDATLEQTIVAIHQANRSAFIDNNPNLIRQGRTLRIPDEAAIAAVDASTAQRQLRLAAEDFRSYKGRLAGAPRDVTSTAAPGATATGAVTARVEDNAARQGPADRLELSRPTGTDSRQAGALGSSEAETRIARDAALTESTGRIAELERNVANLQKMLELKNRSLSDLQTQLDQLRTAAPGTPGSSGAPGATSAAAGPAAAPSASSSSTPSPANPPAAGGTPAATASAALPATGAAAGAGGSAPPSADGSAALQPGSPGAGAGAGAAPASATAAAADGSRSPASTASAPAQPAPASLLAGLTNDPIVLPALGGLALLIAFGVWIAMRRRNTHQYEDSLVRADAYTANSLFGTTSEHHVETISGAPTQIGAMTETAVTEVDPIAEADVYIAYGRDAQAEEILREALKRQPERQTLRLKLLEIYSARKDARSFEETAREMMTMTGGQNEEWPRVAAMGLALDRDNALYAGAMPQTAAQRSSFGQAAAVTSMAAASSAAAMARGPLDMPLLRDEPGHADSRPGPLEQRPTEELEDLDFHFELEPATAADAEHADALDEPLRFQSTSPGPLSAMPGVELPSLDLDMPSTPPVRGHTETGFAADIASLDHPRGDTDPYALSSRGDDGDLPTVGLDLEPLPSSRTSMAPGSNSGNWQEMASKLDLASAYGEIGDKEGARELLQEVVAGGDASQQQRARELLATI